MGNLEATLEHAKAVAAIEKKNSEAQLERAKKLAFLPGVVRGDQRSVLFDKALAAMEIAVEEGFSDPFRIQAEYELRPLRNNPKFKSILAKLE